MRLNTLNIHVTNKCNLKCKHCLYDSGVRVMEEMNLDQIKSLIDQFCVICSGKGTINIYGGESLLRKDIFNIFQYIEHKGLNVGITTNVNFSNNFLEKFYKLNLNRYTLNIDGGNKDSHDWLRNKKGHFDQTLNIITILKEKGKFVAINCVLHTQNMLEVQEILNICKKYRIDAISFYLFTFLGRGSEYKDLMMSAKEWIGTRESINKWIANNSPNFVVIWERAYANKGILKNLHSCLCEGEDQEVIDIACDGSFYYCGLLMSVGGNSLGNIKDMSLIEVLKKRKKMNLKSKYGCAALAIQANDKTGLNDPRRSYKNIVPICPYDWEVINGEIETTKEKFIHIS